MERKSRLSRRDFLRLSAVATTGAVLAACVPATPEPTEEVVEEEEPKVVEEAPEMEEVIVSWLSHWSDPDVDAYWDGIIEEFEAENPGIKVERLTTAYTELLIEFMTAYGVGDSPDTFHFNGEMLPDLATAGAMTDAPEEVAQGIEEGWAPAAVEGVKWEGEIKAIPTEYGTRGFLYNRDLLNQAGVDEPTLPDGYTFDEYVNMAKAVHENTDAAGYALAIQHDSAVTPTFYNFLINNGGEFVDDEKNPTKCTFNSPEGVEVLKIWQELLDEGAAILSTEDDTAMRLATDAIASMVRSNWWKLMFFDAYDETHEITAQENFGVAGVPWDDAKFSLSYIYAIMVSSQSENPEAAWTWARYFGFPRSETQNSPFAEFITSFYGVLPSNMLDAEISPAMQEPYSAAFVPIVEQFGRMKAIFKGYKEVEHVLAAEIEAAYDGKDAQEALDTAAELGNEALAEAQKSD
jgi:ABC-type glycerol-3-phosphate transport system substrate-binding protein